MEYIFNKNTIKEWEFINRNPYIIFDYMKCFVKGDSVRRDGCYLGLPKKYSFNNEVIVERNEISGWEDYLFYNLDLLEYQGIELAINNTYSIPIEDRPVVKRVNFKTLFEDWNVQPLYGDIHIYEDLGNINIISPFIQKQNMQVYFYNLENEKDMGSYIVISSKNSSVLEIHFSSEISSGVYKLSIKYKNKTVFWENFLVDKESRVKREYELSYSIEKDILTHIPLN